VQIGSLHAGFIEGCEVPEMVDDRRESLAGGEGDVTVLHQDVEGALQLGIVVPDSGGDFRGAAACRVGGAPNRADRRVHLVGDAGHQASEGGHLLSHDELVLCDLEALEGGG